MQSPPIDTDQLNAYIDGVLTPAERRAVENAIADDPALAGELRDLKATSLLLHQLPEYTPRRSFTLGAEYARPEPVAAPDPGRIVQLLPLIRTLSIAAALVFMVVGGALFFDINGDTTNDAPATFEQQNDIMGASGETESHDGASQDAEDANESSMTERGEAASVGDEPMDDLTSLQDDGSGDEVAQAGDGGSTTVTSTSQDSGDHDSWKWTTAIIGSLAVVLAGLWFALAQVGRQSGARRS
jgi:hypothetical protein